MSEENMYSAPESNLINEEQTESELASRWARLGASLIDSFITMILILFVMVLTGAWQRALEDKISFLETSLYTMLGLVIIVILHGHLLAKYGQTIGKRIVGIKIVKVESGDILPLSKIVLLRYLPVALASAIPGVGQAIGIINALFIFTKDKRCIHDHIAGTKVVKVGV